MNQMIETIQAYHQEILRALNALSGALVGDAEGTHCLQLIGFLRHKLLPTCIAKSIIFTSWLTRSSRGRT